MRLAYYLMTINASAVALVLGQLRKSLSLSMLLLLAVASWVLAFCLGVKYLLAKNLLLVANIQASKVTEGSHELIAPDAEEAPEVVRQLIGEYTKANKDAGRSAKGQLIALVIGAALYAAWLFTRAKPLAW
jgi:hypothetical protein